ncbi:hypothetical protein [Massilia sp. erpn]|uniref:hypothetical protein n=1 Tax=Massilia sp. erpn TaxID=2738142 RepID=UPI0021044D1F|nr:hypothetical protein [Massilia sp. erpn]
MSARPISTLALIGTTLLSSPKVLALVQAAPFQTPIPAEDVRREVYLSYLPWAAREPDHVFERAWQMLMQQAANRGRGWLLPGALQAMAGEFLAPRHGSLYVKLEKFGVWQQSVASRICCLPVQAAGHAWPPPSTYLQELEPPLWLRSEDSNTWASAYLPILTPYDPLVEDYIQREGLHETHLHLNGSTHAEQCWLRALYEPEKETANFSKKWGKESSPASRKVRELALALNPAFSPTLMCTQLMAAARLREWLVAAATGAIPAGMELPPAYADLATSCAPAPRDAKLALHAGSGARDELRWIYLLLKRLEVAQSGILERMLHCYLLLQNQYYRLLVQNEEQFGFDQFQKFTWTELRDPVEKEYRERFLAMHGKQANSSRTGFLEGRFAPKDKPEENAILVGCILKGYWRYLRRGEADGDAAPPDGMAVSSLLDLLERETDSWLSSQRRHLRLALVCHFIKQPWNGLGKDAGPYRYSALRKDVEKRAHALIRMLADQPRLRTWVRGIDAAANELHAPPEVFASCYRLCRQAGLTHRSYHVGEDFPHLLTGLRHMLDTLELLDLCHGDRIGHGTAMGILPGLWLARMPDDLVLNKGDWLLDLLATWRLLRRIGATSEAYRVEGELATLASQLFDKDISCAELERAMRFRGLHLGYLQKAMENPQWTPWLTPLEDLQHAEALRVHEAMREHGQDLKLLWTWLSDKALWARSESMVTVKANFLDEATYLRLQQALMQEVADRGVLVETLPSSNVRISQYNSFNEHHSLRWMRVPGFVQDGDPAIMVTLGSDDPGIFAGDLNSEFYQLYATLRGQGIGDKDALNYLATLNERGRQYRFHDPVLG